MRPSLTRSHSFAVANSKWDEEGTKANERAAATATFKDEKEAAAFTPLISTLISTEELLERCLSSSCCIPFIGLA